MSDTTFEVHADRFAELLSDKTVYGLPVIPVSNYGDHGSELKTLEVLVGVTTKGGNKPIYEVVEAAYQSLQEATPNEASSDFILIGQYFHVRTSDAAVFIDYKGDPVNCFEDDKLGICFTFSYALCKYVS